jgi:hypothetical protein
LGRPNKLTDNQATPLDWVKDVLYNTAGQMTQMKYWNGSGAYYTETREFNVLGQTTRIAVPGVRDFTYTFSPTQNDGRITQMTDAISGETVVYQYDSLKRLTSAETTGPQWGQSFSYDGFGNLLSSVATKGSAPAPLDANVDNRLVKGIPGRHTQTQLEDGRLLCGQTRAHRCPLDGARPGRRWPRRRTRPLMVFECTVPGYLGPFMYRVSRSTPVCGIAVSAQPGFDRAPSTWNV